MTRPLFSLGAFLLCAALAGAAQAQTGIKIKPAGQGVKSKPAASAPAKPAAAPEGAAATQPDPKRIEAIFDCMAAGLPADWKRAWVHIEETKNDRGEREFDAQFSFSRGTTMASAEPLKTCNAGQVAQGVYELNEYIPTYEQRQWKAVTLEFTSEGAYSLKYEYAK